MNRTPATNGAASAAPRRRRPRPTKTERWIKETEALVERYQDAWEAANQRDCAYPAVFERFRALKRELVARAFALWGATVPDELDDAWEEFGFDLEQCYVHFSPHFLDERDHRYDYSDVIVRVIDHRVMMTHGEIEERLLERPRPAPAAGKEAR